MKKIHFHINPSKFPVFYGWFIVIAGIIGILMSIPGQTMGVSVFTDYLIQDLHLSRVQLSTAYLIGTISSAFLLTYAGRLYDRYGARIVASTAAFLLALTLFYLTRVDNITTQLRLLLGNTHGNWIMFATVAIGFLGIRFFGQGVLTMASRNMVMKWFDRRRGLVSAIMGMFITFGFSYSPRLLNDLIEMYTWRQAWIVIALVVGILFVLFALYFFRDNPQRYGLIPDGKIIRSSGKNGPTYGPAKDYDLKEARATYSFWIFNLALTMYALYLTALTFHIVSIFDTGGMGRERALAIFLPSALVGVGIQIVAGYVSDYIRLKYLLIIEVAGLALSMAGLMFIADNYMVWIIIIGNGIAQGVFGVISTVSWPRFFGTRHLGAISGFNMSWVVAGSAIGPVSFSLSYRWTGSYFAATLACFFFTLVLLLLSFKANNVNEVKSYD